MRWRKGPRSSRLEDRRFDRGPGLRLPGRGPAGLGVGGIVVLLVLSLLFGQDFMSFLNAGPGTAASFPENPSTGTVSPEEEDLVSFVSFVLDDAQGTWEQILPQLGTRYEFTTLVLFRDGVQSACGFARSASGPFYCPGDAKVYLDLSFFDELTRRFGAPGDFAQAYVIAHEIGHHVQNVLGIERQVRQAQRSQPSTQNQLSVLMELQADCFAGVWGYSTARRDILERGDVEEGLNAAAAIGDDRIQSQTTGYVTPESFTHGSSRQRVDWFRRGLQTGDVESCDTFAQAR